MEMTAIKKLNHAAADNNDTAQDVTPSISASVFRGMGIGSTAPSIEFRAGFRESLSGALSDLDRTLGRLDQVAEAALARLK